MPTPTGFVISRCTSAARYFRSKSVGPRRLPDASPVARIIADLVRAHGELDLAVATLNATGWRSVQVVSGSSPRSQPLHPEPRPPACRSTTATASRRSVPSASGSAAHWAFLAAATLAALALVWVAVRVHHYHDLRVYQGALRYWTHGGDLYGYILQPENLFGFTYPPFAALIMLPLAVTPAPLASTLSVVL